MLDFRGREEVRPTNVIEPDGQVANSHPRVGKPFQTTMESRDDDRHEALRANRRYPLNLRAHSDLLPGLTATTQDLSLGGVRLDLLGPLELGEALDVNLELDNGREPLSLWAIVRWCHATEPYQAGLQFLGATVPQRKQLDTRIARHS